MKLQNRVFTLLQRIINILSFKKTIFLLLIVHCSLLIAQDIPDRPNPPKLVNDFVGVLSSNEQLALENKLVQYDMQTSTQIAVVIVKSLAGYDPGDFAQRLGEKWGVGQKGKNNGIILLIKPIGGKGERKVYISTGYGLEAVIPDITANHIVDNVLLPAFRANKLFRGIDSATTVLISLANKDFPASEYEKRMNKAKIQNNINPSTIIMIVIIFIIIIISTVISAFKRASHITGAGTGNLSFWATLFLLSSMNNRGGGSWNDFSSGSGGFGGGSSFGGFGGGSFGGGGAGGSW